MNQTNYAYWDNHRGRIESSRGGWKIGQAVYNRGYDKIQELVGNKSYFDIVIFNIVGRIPDPHFSKWLEYMYSCISWPDPRIWCNQVSTLCGTMRTTPVPGACAGILASDSKMYGSGTFPTTGYFIQQALKEYHKGKSAQQIIDEELAKNSKYTSTPVVAGYARPIASGDERVKRLKQLSARLGMDKGPHETLSEEIHHLVNLKTPQNGINVGGYSVAVMLDYGYSLTEIYRFISMLVLSGAQACYAEAYDNPPESYLPLQCDDIDYIGKPIRQLPNQ